MNPVQVHQIGQYPACLSLLPPPQGESWMGGGAPPYAGGVARAHWAELVPPLLVVMHSWMLMVGANWVWLSWGG